MNKERRTLPPVQLAKGCELTRPLEVDMWMEGERILVEAVELGVIEWGLTMDVALANLILELLEGDFEPVVHWADPRGMAGLIADMQPWMGEQQ